MDTSQNSSSIRFWHRANKKIETELVYGDRFIRFLYDSSLGKLTGRVFANKYFSQIYGHFQDQPASHKKVRPFIQKFNIPIQEYEGGSHPAANVEDSYLSFNEFFIRKFKPGQRSFVQNPKQMPAFAEARYVGFKTITEDLTFPVKGKHLTAQGMLANPKLAKIFEGGPLMVARLCPVDYHRYHYPDSGQVLEHYMIHGEYDSVNPLALKLKSDILIANERQVSILETENFGRIAYIEVGAICVGKIVQSHPWDQKFSRGDEKGYFLFGGSTVVILGEKGAWAPSQDILENTAKGIETYIKLGDEVATRI
ncbi:MAG: phosphatidylserine decarboxylase [Proteobacteria bacterium]|jgi:phosphatidylserine decarboxylase|nr:phosphatidylserine decarboxylase [Pseudomonadota bacterium]